MRQPLFRMPLGRRQFVALLRTQRLTHFVLGGLMEPIKVDDANPRRLPGQRDQSEEIENNCPYHHSSDVCRAISATPVVPPWTHTPATSAFRRCMPYTSVQATAPQSQAWKPSKGSSLSR